MTDAAIAADLDQPLDVLAHLLAQLAFDGEVLVNVLADAPHFVVRKVAHLGLDRDVRGGAYLVSSWAADAENIAQRDLDSLLTRYIDACDTRQGLALPLLVARVGADDAHDALAAYDLALFAAFSD